MTINETSAALEALLDQPGMTVPALLYALASVCSDKAEHVRANWQDEALGKAWDRAQTIVEKAADKMARSNTP